jgi:hypothetical protein
LMLLTIWPTPCFDSVPSLSKMIGIDIFSFFRLFSIGFFYNEKYWIMFK